MFKMMVAPWRDASPYLGVGTYYRARDAAPDAEPEDLVDVTLADYDGDGRPDIGGPAGIGGAFSGRTGVTTVINLTS